MTPESSGCACKECPFAEKGKPVGWTKAEGNPSTARALVVGDCPTREESENGRIFTNSAAKEMFITLAEQGLEQDTTYRLYAIACRPRSILPVDFRKAAQACSPFFVAQLSELPDSVPTLIVGEWAWRALTGRKNSVEKGRGFVREIALPRKPFKQKGAKRGRANKQPKG